ncbi:MAG TPA: helix-turn-helix transcriptional regulator [Gaiellaceae bacterium]|nr:helix-turn-helix transcriptional regulator [Gaiellaceae bacterium]
MGAEPCGGQATLSERERSVLRFLADGYRNDAIGRSLGIAADTVRAHIRNAMRKLDAETRTQAIAIAMRRHLIE